jgi:hypothetical protein
MKENPKKGQKVKLNEQGLKYLSKFCNTRTESETFIITDVRKPTYLDHYKLWLVKVDNVELDNYELNGLHFDLVE